MNGSKKELTIDELVEEINTFPPFDPEELTRRLENPIARRMFCLDSSWKHHNRRNILPPSRTLVEAVLARAGEKTNEKTNNILIVDVRGGTLFVNHPPVEKKREELTSAQEKLRFTLSLWIKYFQSGVVCKVSQEILDEIKSNLSKRSGLPPEKIFPPCFDSLNHPRGHFGRENPDGVAREMAEEIFRGSSPKRY